MLRSAARILRLKIVFLLILSSLSFGNTAVAKEWWKITLGGVTINAEVVKTDKAQQRGLGNRFFLPEDRGMLFYYRKPGTRIFWMKNMHFPIDILWIRNNRIIKIERNVPPPSPNTPDNRLKQYGFGISADRVLEVQAGFTQKHHIRVGDSLQINQHN